MEVDGGNMEAYVREGRVATRSFSSRSCSWKKKVRGLDEPGGLHKNTGSLQSMRIGLGMIGGQAWNREGRTQYVNRISTEGFICQLQEENSESSGTPVSWKYLYYTLRALPWSL